MCEEMNIFTTPPERPVKSRHLTDEQMKQFYSEGFVIIPEFFDTDVLEKCKAAFGRSVDTLVDELISEGKLTKRYEDLDLFKRLTEICKECPGANMMIYKKQVLHEEIRNLWSHPKLLDVCAEILGEDDVAAHPVWNLRVKLPSDELTQVPWHQDSGYYDEYSDDHMILTGWIPFLDTGPHNGGMELVKRSHRKAVVAPHKGCWESTFYLMMEEEDMEKTLQVNVERDAVPCHVPYGGILLFNNLTVHRSTPNTSNDIRWSLDLRWQSPRHHWGYYGIVDGILLRTEDGPLKQPDWQTFLTVNRRVRWLKDYAKLKHVPKEENFDLTVAGPWIGRWPIVNQNQHTRKYEYLMSQAKV